MAKLLGTGLKAVTLGPEKSGLFGPTVLKNKIGSVAVGYPVKMGRSLGVTACARPAQAEKTRKPRGIMKPRPISPELQEFVGVSEISRTQALKVIWAHIKANNLQDPKDKKTIICDEKLKKIFAGKETVGFLQISGLITPHLL
ncbi:zinc finger CCCH domain-containing protein 44-like [Silene latifolia]|uniref:zinc finger CCCH domain-containing protein 44-like n=1 Tax=Silene latifolia TaxID=37657 RepID=UPI003D776CCF